MKAFIILTLLVLTAAGSIPKAKEPRKPYAVDYHDNGEVWEFYKIKGGEQVIVKDKAGKVLRVYEFTPERIIP